MHVFTRKKAHCYLMAHSFAIPVLIYLHARELFMFLFSSADFLQNKVFLQINHLGPPSECQTVWIQIKTVILLVFIWIQTVRKRLLVDDKNLRWHAKSYNR